MTVLPVRTPGNLCFFKQYENLYYRLGQSPNGFWTEPYTCKRDNKAVISFGFPVKNPETNETIGTVSGEIAMEYINHVVSESKIGKEGISFIINKLGLFLTHPVHEWVLKRNLYELSNKILPKNIDTLRELADKGQHGSGFGYPEMFNYRKSWFYFAPMQFTNWIVIIIIPEKELFSDLWLVFRQIVVVSFIGIILIFFLITFIFKRTLHPLVQITEDIHQFSFEGRKDNVKNEVVSLVESLEELQTRYDRFCDRTESIKKR